MIKLKENIPSPLQILCFLAPIPFGPDDFLKNRSPPSYPLLPNFPNLPIFFSPPSNKGRGVGGGRNNVYSPKNL